MNVCILGRGRVGRTLHAALRKADVSAQLTRGTAKPRRTASARHVFVLAVPDAEIQGTAARLLPSLARGDVVLHCSGNRGPEELSVCRERGAHVATMHPMVSFASARAMPPLDHTVWLARGDKPALAVARRLARSVGAQCVAGPSGGPAYHAAAALLGNGSVALAALAVRVLLAIDLDQKTAERAAAGLLRSVASNLERVGIPHALTGPIVRGDADTVRSHVRALHTLDPQLARSYVALAPLILSCASDAGLSAEDATRIQAALGTGRPPQPRAATRTRSKSKRAQKPRE